MSNFYSKSSPDNYGDFRAMKNAKSAFINIPDPIYSGRLWTHFGDGDNAPNLWTFAIENSPTARLCVGKIEKFIKGHGFKENGDMPVNATGLTANELLAQFARSAAYWNGTHVSIVKFTGAGEVGSVYPYQVSFVRKREDGKILTNKRFGTGRRALEKAVEHTEFNRFEDKKSRVDRVLSQVEKEGYQVGDVLYRMKDGEGLLRDVYPIPEAYAGLETIIADNKLAVKDLNLIAKGFSADKIIIYPKEIDRVNRDEAGKTQHDYYREAMSEFQGEDGSGVMLLDGNFIELMPDVKSVDNKAALDSTETANNRIPKAICRMFHVPPVLIGMDQANILGNQKALSDSMEVFNLTVKEYQGFILQTFRQLYPAYNWEIQDLQLFKNEPNNTQTL